MRCRKNGKPEQKTQGVPFSANASGAFEFLPSGVESPLAGPFYFPRKTQCWICGHFLGT